MPGHQDPSFIQLLTEGRFWDAIVMAALTGMAVGAAVRSWLKRQEPKTKEDKDFKNNLEAGVIKQVAHDLACLRRGQHDLNKGQQELRERVVRIETILERNNGGV